MTEQEKIRREKLEEIKKLGINPYPAELFPVKNYSLDLIEKFDEKKSVTIAGRIMSRRIQGNASFAEIQDSKGRIQLYFNRDEICNSIDEAIINGIEVEKYELLQRQAEAEIFKILETK